MIAAAAAVRAASSLLVVENVLRIHAGEEMIAKKQLQERSIFLSLLCWCVLYNLQLDQLLNAKKARSSPNPFAGHFLCK